MFTDEVREAVSIDSRWRKVPELRDAVCQTAVVRRTEASVQIRRNARSGTQTDPVECRDLPAFDGSVEPSIDSPRLARFLRQVEPMVSKELMKNIKSHAFDGFEVNWIDHPNTVSCLHTLHYPEAQKRKLHVTGVSWNVTGSVIACAYGRLEDGDWSTEKSYVCSWNLDRRGLNPERPNTVIDVSSAVMCLAFHPVEPSLIAGGLYSGEVLVWNNSKTDDPLIARSGMSEDTHREPVYQVHWIQSLSRSNRINVLSASTDGKILIWQMDGRGRLVLQDGFALIVQQMPRNVKLHKVSEDSLFGVTSLSFSRLDKTVFIAGVEGGYVLKCSTEVLTHAALSSGSVPLKAPAQFTFSPHCGPVHAVDCSPFHRNLFLTAGTDGHVHLYSMLQAEPILSLQLCQSYLFSVNWSFVRPLVFAAATGEGTVLIFDLGHSSLRPTVSIEQNTERKPVYCLAFNPKRPELLAAGNAEGSVKIWQLSAELTKEGSREISLLEQFANEAVD
ncbi:WD repeat-containing protein 34 isoform X1 [Stegostoma tigrinum]|uniref:WD repeat-containing protein 34 isoform X1 n=1 Tax=Stegostoma tigrinum TaxID=3053191 RepID=UPI00202B18A1|nr:WD repeat-containing protein 34 isoform X1 [Stegostoma tigrinum]